MRPFVEDLKMYSSWFFLHCYMKLNFCERYGIKHNFFQIIYFPKTVIYRYMYFQAISANSPPLPPREHLAVLDALGCVRSQLQQTEQADSALCRTIESAGSKFFVDPNLLLLKATSAASLHCLTQCMNILQRNQHAQQARTGFVIDDD